MLLSNVNVKNQNTDAVVALIRAQQPDLVVIIETNERWLSALANANLFPYRIQSPQAQQFGMAMYSKFPLQKHAIETFDGAEDFHLAATLEINGDLIEAIALHPPPPKNQKLVMQRNRELEAMSRHIQTLKHPVVVAGDFNTSLWSPYYQQFSQQARLQDSRQGFGILPTWPTWIPFLYIPIDQGLVSADIQVIQIQTGNYVGSDHLPMIMDLVY